VITPSRAWRPSCLGFCLLPVFPSLMESGGNKFFLALVSDLSLEPPSRNGAFFGACFFGKSPSAYSELGTFPLGSGTLVHGFGVFFWHVPSCWFSSFCARMKDPFFARWLPKKPFFASSLGFPTGILFFDETSRLDRILGHSFVCGKWFSLSTSSSKS